MIIYNNRTWLGSVFNFRGTVLPHVAKPVGMVCLWAAVVHQLHVSFPSWFESELQDGHMRAAFMLLGKFVSFFLVFRTNGAYHRYWTSNLVLKQLQVFARELHMLYIVYVKGGQLADKEEKRLEWEAKATRCKTDATRYILAYLIAFKMHSRIAFEGYMRGHISDDVLTQVLFDRARLRGLLTSEEFETCDKLLYISGIDRDLHAVHHPAGCCTTEVKYPVSTVIRGRVCHLLLYFMFCLNRDTSVYNKEWGWLERALNLADGRIALLMRAFEEMDQNVSTPLPLPYQHLCKMLMFTFMITFPLVMNNVEDGLITNMVVPAIIAFAMFGIEVISMEIEDPFGDDANDFDAMKIIAAIESSMYEVMLCRNEPSCDNFAWIQAPPDYQDCNKFLALASEQRAMMAMVPEFTACQYKSVAFPSRPPQSVVAYHLHNPFRPGASGHQLWRFDKWSWDWKAPQPPAPAPRPQAAGSGSGLR